MKVINWKKYCDRKKKKKVLKANRIYSLDFFCFQPENLMLSNAFLFLNILHYFQFLFIVKLVPHAINEAKPNPIICY